jgi:hypothetical protein
MLYSYDFNFMAELKLELIHLDLERSKQWEGNEYV